MESKLAITHLLREWKSGDEEALHRLIPIVYRDLLSLARRKISEPGRTLSASALVNETYLRLIDAANVDWQDRGHFFSIAARLMRQVLVDTARNNSRVKRGGGWERITLAEAHGICADEIVALDDAMAALQTLDPRKAKVVELRYFGGMTNEEIAVALAVSVDTVKRDWSFARLWLARQMGANGA